MDRDAAMEDYPARIGPGIRLGDPRATKPFNAILFTDVKPHNLYPYIWPIDLQVSDNRGCGRM